MHTRLSPHRHRDPGAAAQRQLVKQLLDPADEHPRRSGGASRHTSAVTATRRADAVTEADTTSSDSRTRVPTSRASTRGDVVTVISVVGASNRTTARRAVSPTIINNKPATPRPIAIPRTGLAFHDRPASVANQSGHG